MTRVGDSFVRCCTSLNHIPAAVMCVAVYVLQASVLNYYLVEHMGTGHLAWIIADVIVLVLLVASIVMSSFTLEKQRVTSSEMNETASIAWITWFLMHAILACKVIISFLHFSTELEEAAPTFFGPNTFKTAIALGSCVFLLLLTTQHDAPPASERKQYIEDLTGTVFLDLLDTVDILEILFDEDERPELGGGFEEVILAVAALNLLLPTIPLITLSKTKFGHSKLQKRMVYWHKLLIVLVVNVPNLLVRLVLWHGFSVGISPFTLKNIILIIMTLYEFYEHKLEKYELHEREKQNGHGGHESVEMQSPSHNHNGKELPVKGNGFETGNDGRDNGDVDFRDNRRAMIHHHRRSDGDSNRRSPSVNEGFISHDFDESIDKRKSPNADRRRFRYSDTGSESNKRSPDRCSTNQDADQAIGTPI